MNRFDEIIRLFPIRNTAQEKAAFRKWAMEEAGTLGYSPKEIDNAGHKNLAIGDTDRAKVIFTAHYDTPWCSPWPNLMLPDSRALHFLYQMGIVLPFLAVSFLAAYLVMSVVPLDYTQATNRLVPLYAYLFTYYVLFFYVLRGRKNKHNFNDNTSGIALLFQIMEKLSPEDREKCAFLLFDNEERGKKGSKAFAKANKAVYEHTPIVNFDCVGYGDQFVVIEKECFQENGAYKAFHDVFSTLKNAHVFSNKKAHANSDQTSFRMGNAVMTCALSKKGILYVNRIHTKKDTMVNQENLSVLSDASVSFVKKI